MRYFVIRYIRRPNGQFDEISEICKKIKPSTLQSASIILDFAKLEVLLSTVNGVTAPKDWQLMMETYKPHYQQHFQALLDYNHPQSPEAVATN